MSSNIKHTSKIKSGDIVVYKKEEKYNKYKVTAYIYIRDIKNKFKEVVTLSNLHTQMEYYEVPVEEVELYLPEFK